MKRITFLAVIVALFTINAAKAQVGVHVGLNIGTPYYPHHRVVYYPPAPAPYYAPAPVYYNAPVYGYGYYRRPVYVGRGYYGRPAYYNRYHRGGYRRW